MRFPPNVLLSTALLFLVASCAHHRDVRPGYDGVHSVLVRSQEKEWADREAISQANHFCSQRQLAPAFIDESNRYNGEMDEGTRDTIRRASTVAMVLGGVGAAGGYGYGHRGSRDVGTVLGAAGTTGMIMTGGEVYEARMTFKCQ